MASDDWKRVRKTVTASGRSPLWRWMHRNHDKLSALFEQTSPVWEVLVEEFGGMGLTDREGKNPTAETARKTWYRVRRNIAAARARRMKASASPSVPGVAFLGPRNSHLMTSIRPDNGGLTDALCHGSMDPSRRKFGLAQLRGHTSSSPTPPPPAPEPERMRRTPEEVERIIAGMLSGAPKNPFRREG